MIKPIITRPDSTKRIYRLTPEQERQKNQLVQSRTDNITVNEEDLQDLLQVLCHISRHHEMNDTLNPVYGMKVNIIK